MSKTRRPPRTDTLTPDQAALAVEIQQAITLIRMNGWPQIEKVLTHVYEGLRKSPGIDPCLFTHEARAMVMRERGHGVECPCCGQNAQIYPRTITRGMLRWLAEVVRRYMKDRAWIRDRRFTDGGGDYGKLRFWGFIEFEERPESTEPKRKRQRVGVRPTRLAVAFLQGLLRVPRNALLYNGDFLKWKDQSDTISVRDVKSFNWEEIMEGIKGAEKLPWP